MDFRSAASRSRGVSIKRAVFPTRTFAKSTYLLVLVMTAGLEFQAPWCFYSTWVKGEE